jgi:hypothetical protein
VDRPPSSHQGAGGRTALGEGLRGRQEPRDPWAVMARSSRARYIWRSLCPRAAGTHRGPKGPKARQGLLLKAGGHTLHAKAKPVAGSLTQNRSSGPADLAGDCGAKGDPLQPTRVA